MSFISIVTVVLNAENTILTTLDSLVSQNFPDLEWIIIDGNSSDGTLELLKKHKKHINHVISEPDNGIYDAMNKGIKHAKGEYIIFLNAGDSFFDKNALTRINFSTKSDLIVGNLLFMDSNTIKKSPENLDRCYMLKNTLPHQATFFHRRVFENFGHFDTSYRIAGDYEFFARMVNSGEPSYCFHPEIIAKFAGGGISSDPKYRNLRKRENHRIRWEYYPKYRLTLKSMRQGVRNLFCSTSLSN